MDKLTYSVQEVSEALGIGRTLTFDLMREGKLPSIKIGRRRLVARRDLERFIEEMAA